MLVAAAMPAWGGPALLGLLAMITALGVAFMLSDISADDEAFLGSVARLPMIALAVLTGFMLLQTLPAGVLAHPIWSSVSPALGRGVWGSITVDTGATLLGALAAGTVLGLFALATAACMERPAAKTMLYALVALSCAVAMLALTAPLLPGRLGIDSLAVAQARAALPLCLVVATAGIAESVGSRLLDRSSSRRAPSGPPLVVTLPLCAIALGLSLGVGMTMDASFFVAVAAGLFVMAVPFIAIRSRTGVYGMLALLVTAVVIGLALTNHLGGTGLETLAGVGAQRSADPVALMSRDAPALGTGAGTFDALSALYRLPGDGDGAPLQATGPTRLGIELGHPVLFALPAFALGAIVYCLLGTLKRGRGRIYPALGAGTAVAMLMQWALSPTAPGLLPAVILALVGGLASAQSKSRPDGR